jgi:sugar lactone lactonase YvrE
MKSKLFKFALSIAIAAASGQAQSTISTIMGEIPGAPNGVPALDVSLNLPSGAASDGKGNVYVSLRISHQVVRIDPSGILYLVAGTGAQGSQGPSGDGGPATAATLSIPTALAFDSSGNLYIADAGSNRIRMVNIASGTISTFAGNGNNINSGDGGPAVNASLDSPSAIAFDASGDLLIADTGNNEIRMVSPQGIITKVAGTGNPAFDGDNGTVATAAFSGPSGVAVDHLGNIYVGDSGNQCVREISTAGITSVIAGTCGTKGSFGDGRQATTAELNNPGIILFDTAGNLYIADLGNDRVRRVTSNGVIANYAGSGTRGAGGDGGYAIAANLNLQGIAIDPQNNLIIADGANFRVRFVTASNGFITTIGGNGLVAYNPTNLLSSGNEVYFSDSTANRIRQFNITGGAASIGILAGNGQETFDAGDDVALTARLNAPRGLALDGKGNIYFADSKNQVVREVTPEGALVTLAGNATNLDTGDGGLAIDAELSGPVDVAVANGTGNVYILEQSGNRIRVITPSNGNINTYAGTGNPGSPSSPTGTALSQSMNGPQGLTIDSSGALYMADTGNNLIRKITTDGNVATIVGTGSAGYTGDGGPALSATVRNPTGVAIDTYGNVYIADTRNNVIREVGADGIISTIAGTGTAGYNGDGSPATNYSLNQPSAVAIGPSCSVLVADVGNQRIRQVFPSVAYTVTTNPSGLNVIADGQTVATPVVLNWLPGTSHTLSGPGSQSGTAGTQYVSTGASQTISVACGAPRASASVSFATQYFLTITAGTGGTVSQSSGYEAAGSTVTLTATPSAGFVFSGWQGACTGNGSCQVTMTSPMSVTAQFTAASGESRRFAPKRVP